MKNILVFIWEILKIVVIALAIVVPIRYFIFQPFFVKGQSMEPNFENGDYLIIDELSYYFREPERGEVIVFKPPQAPSQRYIKRIVGLPGETIEVKDNRVIVYKNGKPEILDESAYLPKFSETRIDIQLTLAEDEYFVLGDNRPASYDSRRWGAIPSKNIIGRVYLRLLPVTALAKISVPVY